MSRFDYVKYDEIAQSQQADFKRKFQDIEDSVDTRLLNGRAKALIMAKLEEAYMWIGKAIRDDQIERNGTAELQEERNDE